MLELECLRYPSAPGRKEKRGTTSKDFPKGITVLKFIFPLDCWSPVGRAEKLVCVLGHPGLAEMYGWPGEERVVVFLSAPV